MIYTCLSGYASDRMPYQPAETGPSRVAGSRSLPSPHSTMPLSLPSSPPGPLGPMPNSQPSLVPQVAQPAVSPIS